MLRSNESQFLNNLEISKRGIVKVASSMVPGREATSKHDIKKVLKGFEKSPDVKKETLQSYQQRAEFDDPKRVGQDFFKDLAEARKHKKQMNIITALCLRQNGVFKVAGRDVYEDLETGDFWKISEDKKHIVRLFKEDDKGISDKRACLEAIVTDEFVDKVNAEVKSTEKTADYHDSAEFTGDVDTIDSHLDAINKIISDSKWTDYIKTTDENYDTKCEELNDKFSEELKNSRDTFKKFNEMLLNAK
jgi:hypothetical protein